MNATAATTNARAGDGGALLVRSLRLDALASGAMGALLAAGGWLLEGPPGAPAAFLVPLGVFLVAYASLLWAIARDARRARALGGLVVAGNIVWVVATIVTLLADWLTLSGLGIAFALLQAAAVVVFVELQWIGLRRAR
jgi:hypothetical protein